MASVAIVHGGVKPKTLVGALRSLSMVLGTPTTFMPIHAIDMRPRVYRHRRWHETFHFVRGKVVDTTLQSTSCFRGLVPRSAQDGAATGKMPLTAFRSSDRTIFSSTPRATFQKAMNSSS